MARLPRLRLPLKTLSCCRTASHASICVGATIDNQIIRELYTNVIAASEKC